MRTLLICLVLSLSVIALADGSDPMPLCRGPRGPFCLPPSVTSSPKPLDQTPHAGCWKQVAHQGPMWFDPCPGQ